MDLSTRLSVEVFIRHRASPLALEIAIWRRALHDRRQLEFPINDNHRRPSRIAPAGAFEMVTDAQVRRLKRLSKTEGTQELAAAKAGMDPKTARDYLRDGRLPSERDADRAWRTRADPF